MRPVEPTAKGGRNVNLGKVIRELEVEPDEALVPMREEAPPEDKLAGAPEAVPALPAAVPA